MNDDKLDLLPRIRQFAQNFRKGNVNLLVALDKYEEEFVEYWKSPLD